MTISLKELLCIHIHGGHTMEQKDIIQLGTSNLLEPFNYEYAISCVRCGKISIIERKLLDDILKKPQEG